MRPAEAGWGNGEENTLAVSMRGSVAGGWGERQAAPSGRDEEVNPYSEGSGNHGRLLSKVAVRRSCLHFLMLHRAARGEEM